MKIQEIFETARNSGSARLPGFDNCVVGVSSGRDGALLVYDMKRVIENLEGKGLKGEKLLSYFNNNLFRPFEGKVLFIELAETISIVEDFETKPLVEGKQSELQAKILDFYSSPMKMVQDFAGWLHEAEIKGKEGLSVKKLLELFVAKVLKERSGN